MNDDEGIPLVQPKEAQASAQGGRSWLLKGLVVGGALLASGAVYSSRREPSSGVVSSLATVRGHSSSCAALVRRDTDRSSSQVDDGASVASEIETVFEILKADYISAKIGQSTLESAVPRFVFSNASPLSARSRVW